MTKTEKKLYIVSFIFDPDRVDAFAELVELTDAQADKLVVTLGLYADQGKLTHPEIKLAGDPWAYEQLVGEVKPGAQLRR